MDLSDPSDPSYRKKVLLAWLANRNFTFETLPPIPVVRNGNPTLEKFHKHLINLFMAGSCNAGFNRGKLPEGSLLYLFENLLNHACNHNVDNIGLDSGKLYYAKRAIKAGEQLFINYMG